MNISSWVAFIKRVLMHGEYKSLRRSTKVRTFLLALNVFYFAVLFGLKGSSFSFSYILWGSYRSVFQETRLCLALLYSLLSQYQLREAQEMGDHMAQLILLRSGLQKTRGTGSSCSISFMFSILLPEVQYIKINRGSCVISCNFFI